jgi:hypothetical protein
MNLDALCTFLLWSLAFNYAFLLVWFLAFVFARPWMRNLHGRWFALPESSFDAIHYGGMAFTKIVILVFNVAPLFALWMMR